MAYIGRLALSRSAGGFSFGWWSADRFGHAVEEHGHDDAHFMFAVGGRYETTAAVEGPKTARAPLVFNPAQTSHRDRFEDGPGVFFSISVPAEQAREAADLGAPRTPLRLDRPKPRALLAMLMQECAAWEQDSPAAAEAICVELLGSIARSEPIESERPRWLRAVEEKLSEESDAPRLSDLAEAAGVHPYHLLRTFRSRHRCSPAEFSRGRRLERASELLTASRSSLSEIALTTGFADQSHFSRRFKRAYGFTPAEFRNLSGASERLVSDKTDVSGPE